MLLAFINKAVSSWEQNKSVSRIGPIQKMADFFGIQKSDIIEPSDVTTHTPKGRSTQKDMPLNHDESKLLADYRNLNVLIPIRQWQCDLSGDSMKIDKVNKKPSFGREYRNRIIV